MSFSTFSDAQPSIVVAAVPTPRTFRNSRRLTPLGAAFSGAREVSRSLLIGSVVTRAAIVSGAQRRIGLSDVTVDAPAHVERRGLVNLLHVLDLAVTRLAGDAGVHVSHVRKVNVLGKLVDPNPRHRLLLVPEAGELGDLGLVLIRRSRDDGVAAHAGTDSG